MNKSMQEDYIKKIFDGDFPYLIVKGNSIDGYSEPRMFLELYEDELLEIEKACRALLINMGCKI